MQIELIKNRSKWIIQSVAKLITHSTIVNNILVILCYIIANIVQPLGRNYLEPIELLYDFPLSNSLVAQALIGIFVRNLPRAFP